MISIFFVLLQNHCNVICKIPCLYICPLRNDNISKWPEFSVENISATCRKVGGTKQISSIGDFCFIFPYQKNTA